MVIHEQKFRELLNEWYTGKDQGNYYGSAGNN
jgi:hypothetical protein